MKQEEEVKEEKDVNVLQNGANLKVKEGSFKGATTFSMMTLSIITFSRMTLVENVRVIRAEVMSTRNRWKVKISPNKRFQYLQASRNNFV